MYKKTPPNIVVAATVLSCMAAFGVFSRAKADTIPPAVWGFGSAACVGSGGGACAPVTDFGVTTKSGVVSGSAGSAEVRSAATPVPSIASTASIIAGPGAFTTVGALGNLFYYGEVVGPGGVVPVNVHVTAIGSLFSMPNGVFGTYSRDILEVNGYTVGNLLSQNGSNIGGFTWTGTVSVLANQAFQIHMVVLAAAEAKPGVTASANAFLDPLFFVDPSTPDAGKYSLVFSPGIGNGKAGGVPEPGTWAMLLLGFAGLGVVLRGSQHRAALPDG